MIFFGGFILMMDIVLRGFFLPAEYHLDSGGGSDEGASIFFRPSFFILYKFMEKAFRIGGSLIIAFTLFPSMEGIILKGLVFGVVAFIIAPGLSMLLAIRIHPYFKTTLNKNNPQ